MGEVNSSHGIVAGVTGIVSGIISWITMRDKCDKTTCDATHKAVDQSLIRIEGLQQEIFEKINRMNETLVAHVAREEKK